MKDHKSSEFIELKVFKKTVSPESGITSAKKPIDIVLAYIDTSTLPYYKAKYLMEEYYPRENTIRIVIRGEDRDYDTLKELGGIHPHPSKSKQGDRYHYGDEILNVQNHRFRSDLTGFVSFTTLMGQVKISKYKNKYIYLVKASGAVPPSVDDKFHEMEYSLPAGCDFQDIEAVRELSQSKTEEEQLSFESSPIYIKRDFIENYPWTLPKVIEAYLEEDETCEIPLELKELLAKLPSYKYIPPTPPIKNKEEKISNKDVDFFRQACSYVNDNFLSKSFPKHRGVTADDPYKLIPRPNHGLAHTLRVVSYVSVVYDFFLKKSKSPELRAPYHDIRNQLQKIRIALLFAVAGRENEISWQEDTTGQYKEFRAKSAEAFKEFSQKDNSIFTKEEIEMYYEYILNLGNPSYKKTPIFSIIDAAHKIDLTRCYSAEQTATATAKISENIGQYNLNQLLDYARNCQKATGDKTTGRQHAYDDALFIKASTDIDFCFSCIETVPKPDPDIQANFTLKPRPGKPDLFSENKKIDQEKIKSSESISYTAGSSR